VGIPNEAAAEESETAPGRVGNDCPAPNRKISSTCLAEAGQMAVCTNQRGNAATSGSVGSVKEDAGGGLVEVDSKPLLAASTSALIGSDPDEEVVIEEATAESGQIAASTSTNQRGASTATGTSHGSVEEEDGVGRDEEDSKPSLVTSTNGALLSGNYPDQEVVREKATAPDEIPSGWKRLKLEPDC
jgi:hypothetical protein